MTPIEYFRTIAAEFESISDDVVLVWMGIAEKLVTTAAMDEATASLALAYYAAHLLSGSIKTASSGGEAKGSLVREKEGDIERAYAAVTSSAGNTNSNTTYGQMYEALLKRFSGPCIMVGRGRW